MLFTYVSRDSAYPSYLMNNDVQLLEMSSFTTLLIKYDFLDQKILQTPPSIHHSQLPIPSNSPKF